MTTARDSQSLALEPHPFLVPCMPPRAEDTGGFNPTPASSVTWVNSPSPHRPLFFVWQQG